jgi:acylphosphatase
MSRLLPATGTTEMEVNRMPIRKNILVKGFVQGVSYRKQTKRIATCLGVSGWVRNLNNGIVEACLEGEESAVDALISWCAFGPKKGRVDEIEILHKPYRGIFSDFRILDDRKTA